MKRPIYCGTPYDAIAVCATTKAEETMDRAEEKVTSNA
jgi:hypothetical protein